MNTWNSWTNKPHKGLIRIFLAAKAKSAPTNLQRPSTHLVWDNGSEFDTGQIRLQHDVLVKRPGETEFVRFNELGQLPYWTQERNQWFQEGFFDILGEYRFKLRTRAARPYFDLPDYQAGAVEISIWQWSEFSDIFVVNIDNY